MSWNETYFTILFAVLTNRQPELRPQKGQDSPRTLFRVPVVPYFVLFDLLCAVVVDDVSECLWQLCVMSNRAERLLKIKLFENLFM